MSKGLFSTRTRVSLITSVCVAGLITAGAAFAGTGGSGGAGGGDTTSASAASPAAKSAKRMRRYRGPRIKTKNSTRCDWLDPSVCMLPWPNNRYTKPASTPTGLRLNLNRASMPANVSGVHIDPTEWNRNDGFSPGQAIIVHIPGMDNQTAFNKSKIVPVTDIRRYADKAQAVVVIDTTTRKRHPIFAEMDNRATKNSDRHLIVRPTVNWEEGHRYIVALRNLRRAGGGKIKAKNAFRVYRDRLKTRQKPVEKRRKKMEGLFRALRKAGIARKNLYLAWDFTVASEQNLAGRAIAMRDDAFAELGDTNLANNTVEGSAPAVTITSSTDTPADPEILRDIEGTLDNVPCYLDQNGCAPGSKFAYSNANDLTPNFNQANTVDVPFRCIIPQSIDDASGDVVKARPITYGHGLLGDLDQVANSVNQQFALEHNMIFCAVDWAGFANEDIDPVIVPALSELSRIPKTFDRTQQGFVNFMMLGRALIHPSGLAAEPEFNFDLGNGSQSAIDTNSDPDPGNDLYFQGISQGGIMGGALTALNPDFVHGALDVNGMNYSTLLERSVDFDLYEALLNPKYPTRKDRQLIFGLLQIVWDRGEANGYAHHMTTDPLADTPQHKVLMHVAYGDHQVSNLTAEIEARTVGARVVVPATIPGRHWEANPFFGLSTLTTFPFAGSALVYYDGGPASFPGTVGAGTNKAPVTNDPNRTGDDPHSYPRRVAEARSQNSLFFDTGTIGGPCADVLLPAAPCFSNGYTG